MVEIPESARPYVKGLVKYHFWILAAVVPFILLPSVFSANAETRRKITAQKSSIDGHVSALQTIKGEADHPNESWLEAVNKRTADVRKEILDQWQAFWASQKPLRAWPQELGPDFLEAIHAVEQGKPDRLPSNLLQRYQNSVPNIVRKLPERMGCQEFMIDDGAGPSAPAATDGVEAREASITHAPLVWSIEDQRRVLGAFIWQSEPTTMQVRLAQEELWVYGVFCDVIHSLNEGAAGAFNATITSVLELAVGFPAAEETPGGRGGGRVMWKVSPTGVPVGEGDQIAAPDPALGIGPAIRPNHPRFNPSGTVVVPTASAIEPEPTDVLSGEGAVVGEGVPVTTADDLFRDWIYVDFEGRPLTAAALKAVPDATMVHLMPFTLRVVIDQRKLDQLLRKLADNPIPIDVRQVRINHRQQGSSSSGALGADGSIGIAAGEASNLNGRPWRSHDVVVELRGTVGLATPPNEAIFGGPSSGDVSQGVP